MSLYISETKKLRSSSGHGVDWRTGVDFQYTGSFTHIVCRVHGDVTHGGLGGFVSYPYFFPQHRMSYLSVGTGLFTNHFFDWQ